MISLNEKLCKDAAESLRGAFRWSEHPAGNEFWATVYDELMYLSKGEPPAMLRLIPVKEKEDNGVL